MTEDQARAICAAEGATFSVRKRRNSHYIYVSRWLPRRAAEAVGYKVSTSNGQQVDRYVCPLDKLGDLDEETLHQRIASLPRNPNKDISPEMAGVRQLSLFLMDMDDEERSAHPERPLR
jgi:hypothetical protein